MVSRVVALALLSCVACGRIAADDGRPIADGGDAMPGDASVVDAEASDVSFVDSGEVTLESACRALHTRLCGAWKTCDSPEFSQWYGDLDACVADRTKGCIESASLAGARDIAAQAGTCLAAIDADEGFACGGFFRYLYEGFPGCRWKGSLGAGSSCMYGLQCASGDCASRGPGCGRCVDVVPIFDACAIEGAPCAEGSTCFHVTDLDTRCLPFVDAGGDCLRKPCHWDAVCRSNKCVERPDLGGACDGGHPCLPDRDCDASTNRCTLAAPVGAGEPCAFDAGVVHACVFGYRCFTPDAFIPHATCVPAKKRGESCAIEGWLAPPCETGLSCVSGRCGVPDPSTCP